MLFNYNKSSIFLKTGVKDLVNQLTRVSFTKFDLWPLCRCCQCLVTGGKPAFSWSVFFVCFLNKKTPPDSIFLILTAYSCRQTDRQAAFTWETSHGSGPRLFVHDVPHQESREAHEHTKRSVGDTNVRFIDRHSDKNTDGAELREDTGRAGGEPSVSESRELIISKQLHPVTLSAHSHTEAKAWLSESVLLTNESAHTHT